MTAGTKRGGTRFPSLYGAIGDYLSERPRGADVTEWHTTAIHFRTRAAYDDR